VTGWTKSSDFTTVDPYQAAIQGDRDVFVTKLSSSGNSLIYSTYLGGTSDDFGRGIVVDDAGCAYVTGRTHSSDFPTENPYRTYQGSYDVFIVKIAQHCCGIYTGGYTGNTNRDTDGKRNLADIVGLIDRVYLSQEPLCCEENGNTNGDPDGVLNLADISKLIDHVYISHTETAPCP
jgi:hypothetical protein